MTDEFRVRGTNQDAPFHLTVHRGEGMALLAMNWRRGRPPRDFVGFGIEYVPPGWTKAPLPVPNRLTFDGTPSFHDRKPSMDAPIQKFRWVHFPFDADRPGKFRYVVTPRFMNPDESLRSGPAQQVELELARETHPGRLNVSFTRGFICSQAFVDNFVKDHPDDVVTDAQLQAATNSLLPSDADRGLDFTPTHRDAAKAHEWMGFEARRTILEVLDGAIADTAAEVRVVAYDLNEPEVVSRLEQLGDRLRVVIDDSGTHGPAGSGESQSAQRLRHSAGDDHVRRQHMGNLQHNKTIVVTGPNGHVAVCGSTNFSWRGFYVQNNNAVTIRGEAAVAPFVAAFEQYWAGSTAGFRASDAAQWHALDLGGLDVKATFSPHSGGASGNSVLASIAADMRTAKSSVLYSLAFLYQTTGVVRDAVTDLTEDDGVFVAGISDRAVGGITVQTPDGNRQPVRPENLSEHVPAPFSAEPTGGAGIRLHHKFVVVDFDKPTARVYLGSYNFSRPADGDNGENLLLVKDRRVATAYAIEAVRLFDHYQFRVRQADAATAVDELKLHKPPKTAAEPAWFDEDWTDRNKVLDRKLFA
ncbi:MAG: phospholipase D-like domain-containing protein [Acidimicrobiia bacterium]